MWPLATTRSRVPSRSQSAKRHPNPRVFRDGAPTPAGIATSSYGPGDPPRYSAIISLSKFVTVRLGDVELFRYPASTPMPARAFPSALNATPISTPTSLNVPFRMLRYNLFGCVSLATKRSSQPSPSVSRMAAPRDFELVSKMPLVAVTSSNVPSPRLRNSQHVSPRYASGVQYDFCLPSMLQNTSCST